MGTDIDHFRPKSTFPQVAFLWANYLLACSHCNSNQKRGTFPVDEQDQPLLIDPSFDNPADDLAYSPSTGYYVGLSARGDETITTFALNRDICVKGRRASWFALEALIVRYAEAKEYRDAILEAIQHQPFIGVRMHMLEFARIENRRMFVGAEVLDALDRFPELSN